MAYVECAGNWRGFFASVLGEPADGSQRGTGAIGCAEWSGPTLFSVLELAGVRSGAVDVNLVGLDDGSFSRPMPIEKAMDQATMLALSMNGVPLPPDHGFPVRGIVPGWAGSNSVKWLGALEVSTEKIWVRNNTTSYVMIGADWPAERYAPAEGAPITVLRAKSALALPWPATLRAGAQRVRGYAYSPHGSISDVEWSVDEGANWSAPRLIGPRLPHAWCRFELEWEPGPGTYTLRTRATDEAGNRQPDDAIMNEKGYLLDIPLPHPVEVV